MAIRETDKIESMTAEEIETALGIPGVATRWEIFGPFMAEHRISLFTTQGWGSGNGVSKKPGWGSSVTHGQWITDEDPLIAGCKALLFKTTGRYWDDQGREMTWHQFRGWEFKK